MEEAWIPKKGRVRDGGRKGGKDGWRKHVSKGGMAGKREGGKE